jgi:hypothetical protein
MAGYFKKLHFFDKVSILFFMSTLLTRLKLRWLRFKDWHDKKKTIRLLHELI